MTRRVMVQLMTLEEARQCEAIFHGFGSEYWESDSGSGSCTVAIVEWPNGQIELVQPQLIQFITPTNPQSLS
jgi:hypothetical protein